MRCGIFKSLALCIPNVVKLPDHFTVFLLGYRISATGAYGLTLLNLRVQLLPDVSVNRAIQTGSLAVVALVVETLTGIAPALTGINELRTAQTLSFTHADVVLTMVAIPLNLGESSPTCNTNEKAPPGEIPRILMRLSLYCNHNVA
jgi:hypothetical protein